MIKSKTFWNGEPCQARRIIAVIAAPPKSSWWCAGLEGTEREVVEVIYGNHTFYLDNDKWLDPDPEYGVSDLVPDGRFRSGWMKVTLGKGSPQWGHRSIHIERIVREVDS